MNQRRLFLGCFVALVATAFAFIIRAMILSDWQHQFGFTESQIGAITGIGLAPFAISIVLFSLFIDRIGYGTTMVFAFLAHVISAVLTIMADSYGEFFFATFIFALANGAVEAVINPVTATIYDKHKTHMLNILHAGWPGGLVLGGILTIIMGADWFPSLPGDLWRWKVGLMFLPVAAYGILLFGQKFPVNERVAAGVSYRDMLREFGSIGCLIVTFMLVGGASQVLDVWDVSIPLWLSLGIAVAAAVLFHLAVGSFGQPIFVIMLIIMVPLAITELGVDSWITKLMEEILADANTGGANYGTWILIYTSAIMFVLRFFAGPIVHRISPLGLLCVCAAIAATGIFWLSQAVGVAMVFAAATCYGIGKSFFWPTSLGVVAEQFPRGGALTLNAIGGLGMLSAGVVGAPLIGYIQDVGISNRLEREHPAVYAEFTKQHRFGFGEYVALDQEKVNALRAETADESAASAELVETRETIDTVSREAKQAALAQVAILPVIMFLSYVGLLIYYRSKGGYKAEVLASPGHQPDDEKFTGGVAGPVE